MMGAWHEIGLHRFRIDEDVVLSEWMGVCSLPELEQFLALMEPVLAHCKSPFLLIDNTQAAPGIPEVRRRLFEWSRTHTFRGGVIVFGATAATRLLGVLILNAIALFKKGDFGKRITIVQTEQEARAWIERRRLELAG